MSNKKKKTISREDIITTIRAEVEANGGKQIGREVFLKRAKMRHYQLHKYFTGWQDALRAAGYDFEVQGARVPEERLLADWGEVARKLQCAPVVTAYGIHGTYCSSTLSDRFGSYRNVPPAFEKFAREKPEWADVLAICANRKRDGRRRPLTQRERKMRKRAASEAGANFPSEPVYAEPIRGRPLHGEPLALPGLGYAPVNESGVVYLFGIIAWRIGFHVELLRPFFPDCEAQRRVGPGQWQRVTIEFEYESRNFALHAHDPKGCDLIVCWEHNWADCPKNLEVIALKDELERISQHQIVPYNPDCRGDITSIKTPL